MIYLLSQMVLALILAGVCGAALGWILHRSTQDKESGNLKNVMKRQRQQISHLQSEIAMLTDDYDELQRQSHDELIDLREANQQIPNLSTNLEKSQLLVSQMLKKHDSQLRELNTQNQTLTAQLASVEHNEQAFNKLQAELDSARRHQAAAITETSLADDSAEEQPVEVVTADLSEKTTQKASKSKKARKISAFDSESGESVDDSEAAVTTPAVVPAQSGTPEPSDSLNGTSRVISNARNTSSWASAPLSVIQDEGSLATVTEKTPDSTTGQSTSNRTAMGSERLDEDLDDVHVVVDEDIVGIEDFESGSDLDDLADATISLSGDDLDGLNDDEEFAQTVDNSPVIFLNADATGTDADEAQTSAGLTDWHTTTADTELELPELPSDVFDVDPFDQVIEIGDDLQKELDDDGQDGKSTAFEPVERQDDLQRIVGIDSSTEKALNDLGITSYAQLAKLKHHEIETIANALKIVPARIENDDWVGNARRQLEDVLEEL